MTMLHVLRYPFESTSDVISILPDSIWELYDMKKREYRRTHQGELPIEVRKHLLLQALIEYQGPV